MKAPRLRLRAPRRCSILSISRLQSRISSSTGMLSVARRADSSALFCFSNRAARAQFSRPDESASSASSRQLCSWILALTRRRRRSRSSAGRLAANPQTLTSTPSSSATIRREILAGSSDASRISLIRETVRSARSRNMRLNFLPLDLGQRTLLGSATI